MTTIPLPMAIRKSLARNDARTARRLLKQLQDDDQAPEGAKAQIVVLKASIDFKDGLYQEVFAADLSSLRVPQLIDSMIGLKVSSRFNMGAERVELGQPWVAGVDRNYFTKGDWNSLVAVLLKRIEVLSRNGLAKNAETLMSRMEKMDAPAIQWRLHLFEHRIGCLREDLERASKGFALLLSNEAPAQILQSALADFAFLLNPKKDLAETVAEHAKETAAKLTIDRETLKAAVKDLETGEQAQKFLDIVSELAPETVETPDED